MARPTAWVSASGPGARVRLVGHDERGVEHTRELVIRGGNALRVAIP